MKKKIDREALAYTIARTAAYTAFFSDHGSELDEEDEENGRVNWAFLPFKEDMDKARKKYVFEYLSEEEEEAVRDTPEYLAHIHDPGEKKKKPAFDRDGRIYGIVCGWSVEDGFPDDDDDYYDGIARLCVRFGYVDKEMPRESYRDYQAWKNPFGDSKEEDDEEPGEDFDWKEYLFECDDDTPWTEFPIYGRNSIYGHDTFTSEWACFLRIAEVIIGLYERAVEKKS